MRSMKVFLSASTGAINQLTRAVLSLVVRRVFLVYISADYLGLNTLFGSIISFLSLSELGVGSAVMMCLYKPLAEKDYKKANAYINLLRKFNLLMMIVIIIGGICLIPIVFSTINGNYNNVVVLKSYLLYLFGTALSYLWSYYATLLMADQKTYKATTIYWICTVIVNILQIILIIIYKNYYLYLWSQILYYLMSNYWIRIIARREYLWLEKGRNVLQYNEKKDFIYKIKDLFIYRIATYLIQSLDNVIVSTILGTVVVAYYGNYYLIVNMLIAIVGGLGSATIASLGNVFYMDDEDNMFLVTKKVLFIQHMIFSATAVAMLSLSDDFVRICFGNESVCSIDLVTTLAILYYVQGITSALENVRTAVGCYEDKYWQLAVSVLNVVVSVALTFVIGISGVVIGTIVCYLIKGGILTPKVIFGNVISKNCYKEYMKDMGSLCISSLLASVIAFLMPSMQHISFGLRFILKGSIAVGCATLVNIIVLHRTNLYKENKKYFVSLIKIWTDKLRRNNV